VLVSGAAVAAVVTAVLLALLVAGLVARTGPAAPLFHGLTAVGTAGAAVGLLALARAAALARAGSVRRARALYVRCTVAAAATGVATALAGVLTAPRVGSPLPAWGGATALVLLALLVALALRLRVATAAEAASGRPPDRRGGGGESKPGRTAGAR
jgi:peptidoglycan/LPS O-acetylase OafA/YrhL